MNILVQQSHQSSVARATIPAVQSQQKFYAAKGSLHEQAYDRLLCLGKHACKEWGLLCREYICCGGSCQEHRGIIFLLAILDGSLFQEGWLQNTGQVAPKSQEYSLKTQISLLLLFILFISPPNLYLFFNFKNLFYLFK